MAAKRLALGLGVEKEETKQVLKDFYQLRDDLGYSLNVDLLAWLLRNALESKSQEEAGKPSRNSANNAGPTSKKQKVIVSGPIKNIVLTSSDGSSELFGNEACSNKLEEPFIIMESSERRATTNER